MKRPSWLPGSGGPRLGVPRSPLRVPRWLAGLVVLWICGISAISGWGYQRQEHALDAIEHESEVRVASQCIQAWAAREDVRDGIEKGARTGANVSTGALTRIVEEVGDPESTAVIARYAEIAEQLTNDGVASARAEVPDPDCDLEEAQRIVGSDSAEELNE